MIFFFHWSILCCQLIFLEQSKHKVQSNSAKYYYRLDSKQSAGDVYMAGNCRKRATFCRVTLGCESLNVFKLSQCHWQEDQLYCLPHLVIKMNDSCYDCQSRFTSPLFVNKFKWFHNAECVSISVGGPADLLWSSFPIIGLFFAFTSKSLHLQEVSAMSSSANMTTSCGCEEINHGVIFGWA